MREKNTAFDNKEKRYNELCKDVDFKCQDELLIHAEDFWKKK